ncbi:hypothetical protein Pan216_34360 [Planctomycetes bacterium Pan216]|uniref:IrrE N-terminal-like domain-containing protein n=1 Tax=Kolteria novifilia TaxID=2527975 RepID=A0A518B6G8_9BACT|nr:hypothetical protein Pan216_34360 [Planctomycetes bacterium Pan216]
MIRPITGVEVRLQEQVAHMLDGAGIERPPVDASLVAKGLGMDICLDRRQRTRGRLVEVKGKPTVFVRPEPRAERTQWTVAHEIGEWMIPKCFDDELDETWLWDEREELANRFATLLLVPTGWWNFDTRMVGCDLLELKRMYETASYELLAGRLLDLDPPTVISIFDHGTLRRRLSNLESASTASFPLERELQRQVHDSGVPAAREGEGIRVQAWPIHEPGWKREILRTVLEEAW